MTERIEYDAEKHDPIIERVYKEWDDWATYGQTLSEEELTEKFSWLYTFLEREDTNPCVILCESPFEAQLMANVLCWALEEVGEDAKLRDKINDKLYAKLHAKLRDKLRAKLNAKLHVKLYAKLHAKLRDKLDDKLYDKLHAKLYAKLYAKLHAKLRAKISDKLYDKLYANLYANLRAKLGDKLYDKLRDKLYASKIEYFYPFWNADAYSFMNYYAFYDAISEIVCDNVEGRKEYKEFLKANVLFPICLGSFVICSKKPVVVYRDERDELHSTSQAAIQFENGENYFFLHGVSFDEDVFEKFKDGTISGEEILGLQNAEQRAVLIQELGFERVFESLKDKTLLDSRNELFNGEGEKPVVYELFKTMIGENTVNMLKVAWYEYGRKRETVLGIPSDVISVQSARAWTFGMTEEEYFNGKLKYRQGDVLVVYDELEGGLKHES